MLIDPHIMHAAHLPPDPLPGLRALELGSGSESLLQRFFEENPQYFETVYGAPPARNEAHDEIHGALPAGWPYTKKWIIGYANEEGSLIAMVNLVSDLLAASVWHIGTFITATSRHGSGDARVIYGGLESWVKDNGARWLRLGVVKGNVRAGRFWERQGFIQARERSDISMGRLTHTLRVMLKPLAGQTMEHYFELVERDRPEDQHAV